MFFWKSLSRDVIFPSNNFPHAIFPYDSLALPDTGCMHNHFWGLIYVKGEIFGVGLIEFPAQNELLPNAGIKCGAASIFINIYRKRGLDFKAEDLFMNMQLFRSHLGGRLRHQ